VTLDQWRAFLSVVDEGGFAQASEKMHRSQSTLSYAVAKIQEQLGLSLLEIRGRKAELTSSGHALLSSVRQLVKDAQQMEQRALHLAQGLEPQLRLVVDVAFPVDLLMKALQHFRMQNSFTQVQIKEVVLSGALDELQKGDVDLAISYLPPNWLGDPLLQIEFTAMSHPQHPLQQLGRPLKIRDLEKTTQVVVEDSGLTQKVDVGWLNAAQQWRVTSIKTAITIIENGLGFGWLPTCHVQTQLQAGTLAPLPLAEGGTYSSPVFLIFGREEGRGEATLALAHSIRSVVS